MGLRLLALLGLVSITLAQTMNDTMNDTTTDAMTTTTMTTMAPMAPMDPTQPAGNSPAALRDMAAMNISLPDRYMLPEAMQTRNEHFFCPDQGQPLVTDTVNAANVRTVRTWTVMLQYPVLAYLDSVHKGALITQIVNIINLGNPSLFLTTNDICIGYVFHYDVSLYTESVLFQIYMRDQLTPPATPQELDAAFINGRRMSSSYVATFRGQQAIVININTYGEVNQNVHPGAFNPDGTRFMPQDDPTLRAVILGHWPRGYTLEEIMTVPALNSSVSSNFAQNPNPVEYGLTGGDIVFIIIATLLCSLLAFLMVFGYCIQPFFM